MGLKRELIPVKGGFSSIAFYEEYNSGSERRRATKGAKLRQPTGKARSYIIVDRRREMFDHRQGTADAYGVLSACYEPGDSPGAIVHHPCGLEYLNSPKVRRVGAKYMPRDWFEALLSAAWFEIEGGKLCEWHEWVE